MASKIKLASSDYSSEESVERSVQQIAFDAPTKRGLLSSSAKIWKSRLSWRIALSAFLTILIVQIATLVLTVNDHEMNLLDELRETGRSAIAPLLNVRVNNLLVSPIEEEEATRLLSSTIVNGIAVYSSDLNLLESYGEPVFLTLMSEDNLGKAYRSPDGSSYEIVYRSNDLQRPFIIIARLDSSHVSRELLLYVRQNIQVMMLLSALVTTVLMITLGRWLLEPILFLRSSLARAAERPERPDLVPSPFDPADEIGATIEMAHELIRQNADNISQMKSTAADQIHKLAYYDPLTSLPNRTLFLQTLNQKIREQLNDSGKTQRYAVIALDIDNFKDVNDSMGHNVGDAILRAVGKRLRTALPASTFVARIGEDEYAITMPVPGTSLTSMDIAQRVAGVVTAEPFTAYNEDFQIRASIGVATFPDDGKEAEQVLKNADIALNRAKEEGRDTIRAYMEDFDVAVQQRFQMLRDLRDAMEADQLTLNYQPQFNLKTGALIGAEALARWWIPMDDHEDGGEYISPTDFIPIAEQSGLIVPIGEWVLKTACETAAAWQKRGHSVRIAVNVSGAQFYRSDIVNFVQKTLHETGLKPENLELEVTESVFMADVHHAIETLQNLHDLGIELAIDDFGTGYSSLSYLRQFPIDRLKIDQSFIANALENPDDAAIARAIVTLARSLGLQVIAEGVESKAHEEFLRKENCDEVQGFRYSKAIPAEDFNLLLENYNGDLASFG